MDWREYQDIVGQMYERAKGIGTVHRNVTRPDKVTGQSRQIDTLIEIEAKGHAVSVLIPADTGTSRTRSASRKTCDGSGASSVSSPVFEGRHSEVLWLGDQDSNQD
jgi:hypothetical protein